MCSGTAPDAIVEAVGAFFAEHEVASVKMPSGWFGRPHDNWHQLDEVSTDGRRVRVRFDQTQALDLDASSASVEDRTVRVTVRSGNWHWASYGCTDEHDEVLGPGTVEFHAPFHL